MGGSRFGGGRVGEVGGGETQGKRERRCCMVAESAVNQVETGRGRSRRLYAQLTVHYALSTVNGRRES